MGTAPPGVGVFATSGKLDTPLPALLVASVLVASVFPPGRGGSLGPSPIFIVSRPLLAPSGPPLWIGVGRPPIGSPTASARSALPPGSPTRSSFHRSCAPAGSPAAG